MCNYNVKHYDNVNIICDILKVLLKNNTNIKDFRIGICSNNKNNGCLNNLPYLTSSALLLNNYMIFNQDNVTAHISISEYMHEISLALILGQISSTRMTTLFIRNINVEIICVYISSKYKFHFFFKKLDDYMRFIKINPEYLNIIDSKYRLFMKK